MTRPLPSHLAPVVEELELEQAFLVTMEDVRRIARSRALKTGAAKIADGLRSRGWLLKTDWRGIWEFAPGAHAGPFGRGHPFRSVVAARLAEPRLDIAVCLNSALWAHGLLDGTPDRPEVAVPQRVYVPKALERGCRVVRFKARLPTVQLRDVPVHPLATVLVHLATRPADVRSWGAVLDALPELVGAVLEPGSPEQLDRELAGRPTAVRTRLAYLVHGVAPKLATRLAAPSGGVVWFGSRGPLKRHHAGFQVVDTVLPMAPGELRSEEPGE
jgi:predicted transcriptional regulator of viral defense system